MKKGTGSHSLYSKEDLYYDGSLDIEFEDFCEYSQTIVKRKKRNDGWDDPEDFAEDVEWED